MLDCVSQHKQNFIIDDALDFKLYVRNCMEILFWKEFFSLLPLEKPIFQPTPSCLPWVPAELIARSPTKTAVPISD